MRKSGKRKSKLSRNILRILPVDLLKIIDEESTYSFGDYNHYRDGYEYYLTFAKYPNKLYSVFVDKKMCKEDLDILRKALDKAEGNLDILLNNSEDKNIERHRDCLRIQWKSEVVTDLVYDIELSCNEVPIPVFDFYSILYWRRNKVYLTYIHEMLSKNEIPAIEKMILLHKDVYIKTNDTVYHFEFKKTFSKVTEVIGYKLLWQIIARIISSKDEANMNELKSIGGTLHQLKKLPSRKQIKDMFLVE